MICGRCGPACWPDGTVLRLRRACVIVGVGALALPHGACSNLSRSTVERMAHTLTDEIRYRLFQYLSEHPEASQRDVARALGISLGKVNYCLRALIDKGWIKVRNFRNSRHKAAYAYFLTPRGVEEKVSLTYAFLRIKISEHDVLIQEIERLRGEVGDLESASAG